MKKLTKKNLDELAKVMPVLSETEQRSYVGGGGTPEGSGLYGPPYTLEEYRVMIASGHWSGGVVEGYGYITSEETITGNKRVTSSFSGEARNYAFSEGVGMNGGFSYKGSYMIENGYMSVGSSVFTQFGTDIQASGEVLVYVNGTEVASYPMSRPSSMAYESGLVPVGNTTFNLQQYSGHVEVKIQLGYTHNNGTGYDHSTTKETIYSAYR
nr:hypothetical protein [uncultured Bacteroides sp.]